jgi:hypothetical protein
MGSQRGVLHTKPPDIELPAHVEVSFHAAMMEMM